MEGIFTFAVLLLGTDTDKTNGEWGIGCRVSKR